MDGDAHQHDIELQLTQLPLVLIRDAWKGGMEDFETVNGTRTRTNKRLFGIDTDFPSANRWFLFSNGHLVTEYSKWNFFEQVPLSWEKVSSTWYLRDVSNVTPWRVFRESSAVLCIDVKFQWNPFGTCHETFWMNE